MENDIIYISGMEYILAKKDKFVDILKKSIANWADSSFMPRYIGNGDKMYYLYEIYDGGNILVLAPHLDSAILCGFVVASERDGRWKYHETEESYGCNTYNICDIRGMYPFYQAND